MSKRMLAALTSLATVLALGGSSLLPAAHAAVNVTVAPTSAVTSPITLPANSAQTELFTFSLNADASETLSSIMPEVDAANASTTVTGSRLASLSLYKDDGSNSFNPTAGNLVGSQSTVNVGSQTTINPATTTPATGKFYLSLATSGSWSGTMPADSVTVTMPSGAIVTSANSPSITPVTTATISAAAVAPSAFNVTVAKYVDGQPATTANTGGDTFDVRVTYPGIDQNYTLGATGINNPNPYQLTSSVPSGDNYSVFEDIYGAVGQTCASNLPYTLAGYTMGSTLAAAASSTPSMTMPSFSNLSQDEYVIVWNTKCSNTPPTATSTTISTQLSAISVAANTPVHDAATLGNMTGSAGGSVTYNVYQGTMCSGTPVWSNTQTVTDGNVPNSTDFTPSANATYNWQAVYSGDNSNQGASSACGSETLTVTSSGQPGTCDNGIINGATYQITGKGGGKYIGVNCTLQPLTPPKPKGDGDGDQDDMGNNSSSTPPNPNNQGNHFSIGNIFSGLKFGTNKGGKNNH